MTSIAPLSTAKNPRSVRVAETADRTRGEDDTAVGHVLVLPRGPQLADSLKVIVREVSAFVTMTGNIL